MAELTLHDVEEELVEELKSRAARNGRSAEEEHRQILRSALEPRKEPRLSFHEHLSRMPGGGEDSDFERIGGSEREIDF
jgi:plasmid stability protein